MKSMSKQVFWPLTLVIMGLIFIASNLGLLPRDFWNLWPLILVIVGLGGLITADRVDWIVPVTKKSPKTKSSATSHRAKR
jgi:hypothetical protein